MTGAFLRDMALLTLRKPAEAAHAILALGLTGAFLWPAVALMAALNAFLYGVALWVSPPPPDIPAFLAPQPLIYAGMMLAMLVAIVFALHRVGRWMEGQGELVEILALVTWMQALSLLVQVLRLVLILAAPALLSILSLVTMILSLWISVHFINEGHRLGSLGKAFFVMVGAGLIAMFGLSMLTSILAVTLFGAPPNV